MRTPTAGAANDSVPFVVEAKELDCQYYKAMPHWRTVVLVEIWAHKVFRFGPPSSSPASLDFLKDSLYKVFRSGPPPSP